MNVGSVGNSYCTPTACYVIIDGELNGREKSPISFEFISVPYDNARAAENARKAAAWFPSLDEYITEITTGTWQPLV